MNYIGGYAFYKTSLISATLSNPEGWIAGTNGFNYVKTTLVGSSTYHTSEESYSLKSVSDAAAALTTTVKIQVGVKTASGLRGAYEYKNWYSQDWSCQ